MVAFSSKQKKRDTSVIRQTSHTYHDTTWAYTLAELLIVVIIIGITAVIGLPQYFKSVEKSSNKQARLLIKMMLEAEKMQRLKTNAFVACANSEECNRVLKLNLPQDKWDYRVVLTTSDEGAIEAHRLAPHTRVYSLPLNPSTSPDNATTCSNDDGYCG